MEKVLLATFILAVIVCAGFVIMVLTDDWDSCPQCGGRLREHINGKLHCDDCDYRERL